MDEEECTECLMRVKTIRLPTKKKYKGLAAAAAVHEGNPEEKDQKKKPARKPPD